MKRFLWIILLGVAVGVHAANEPPTVLILPFQNATNQSQWISLQKGIPDLITAFLSPYSEKIHIVERERLEEIMGEHALTLENVMKESAVNQVGQFAQAHYVLRGSFTGAGDALSIHALIYETESSRLIKSIEASGSRKSLNEQCEKIAEGISAFFSASLKPLTALPADENPELNLHMIQGLGFYYQGLYTKAFPEFMKILQKQPKNADGLYWLGKSFWGAGLKDQAKLEFRKFIDLYAKDSRVTEVKAMIGGRLNHE